jgi:excisionase family DNA binding protein
LRGIETGRVSKTAIRFELKLVGGVVMEETRIRSPLLSVPETAAYLGMSKDWVYERLKTLIPHVKIGGALRFRKEDVDRYIAFQTIAPMNTRDIRSATSLREVIRECPRKNRKG